jgi:hypothetical protein
MRQNTKFPRPLSALLPGIKPSAEQDPRRERLFLIVPRGVIQNDVVDNHPRPRLNIKLNVIDPLILRQMPSRAVIAPELRHIHRRRPPLILRQISEHERKIILPGQAEYLHAQLVAATQTIPKRQPGILPHRRPGHRIEHDRIQNRFLIPFSRIHIPNRPTSPRPRIAKAPQRRWQLAGLLHAAQPPAFFDVGLKVFKSVHAIGKFTLINHGILSPYSARSHQPTRGQHDAGNPMVFHR